MNKLPYTIAMIDDDQTFAQIMALTLENEINLKTFQRPDAFFQDLRNTALPDAVFLDLHLEDCDGFMVCEEIQKLNTKLPVFFLTSDTEPANITRGLTIGGLDYFSKTMSPIEIISRVKGRLWRETLKLRCRNITMNLGPRTVLVGEKEVKLTPKEFDLLKVFMEHQDQILSKATIMNLLWKDVHVNANNIDTHMFHIRKKFVDLTTCIECRKGEGYILRSTLT